MRLLVGAVGIEPTTNGLKGRCSTTELRPCGGSQRFYLEGVAVATRHRRRESARRGGDINRRLAWRAGVCASIRNLCAAFLCAS
jgi:hypothetical protein